MLVATRGLSSLPLELETFRQKTKKSRMEQGEILKNLSAVFSDQHLRLEVSVYQLSVRKGHKGEDLQCTMLALHPTLSSLRSTLHPAHRPLFKSQSLSKVESGPKTALVELLSKDQREIQVRLKMLKRMIFL